LPTTVKSSYPTYQDIRDDRVYTYFDLYKNETKTFRVILNAAYNGKFYLPNVSCEAMYDNEINNTKPGKWVIVESAESKYVN
jgi:alpha-2-macroglobulin